MSYSFKELYLLEKKKPTAGQIFIERIAEITCRQPATIRMWLNGTQFPNDTAIKAIAKELNVEEESLFPDKKATL